MIRDFTDEALTAKSMSTSNLGAARASVALLTISGDDREDLRDAAYSAGITWSNRTPGARMADGVEIMSRNVKDWGWDVDHLLVWTQDNR